MPAATMSRADEKSARKPEQTKEHKILYQTYFKSVGTRTYAAQVKEAGNGNHFILITEGSRDKQTGEVRKKSVIIFSEDFEEFGKLIGDTMQFVRAHPVPPDIAQRQKNFWRKKPGPGRAGKDANANAENAETQRPQGRN